MKSAVYVLFLKQLVMNYYKAVFDLSRPLEDKIPEEKDILAKMSADARFAAPPIPYTDFQNALDIQDRALSEAQFGGIERTAKKRTAMLVVDDMIRKYKLYVDMVADGDTEVILASGFRHTKPRQSSGDMPTVTGVRGGSNGISGEAQIRWNPVNNVSFYQVELRPQVEAPVDGVAEELPWMSYSSKPSSIVISGLKPLTYYEIRVRAVGPAGPGGYSDIVIVLVT